VVHTHHAAEHSVAVQHAAHLPRREEEVAALVVRNEEPEAVGMTDHAPPDQVGLVHRQVGTAPVAQHLTVPLHRAKPSAQGLEVLLAVDPDPCGDLLEGQRITRLGQAIQDQFPARDGVLVLLCLAFEIRIDRRTAAAFSGHSLHSLIRPGVLSRPFSGAPAGAC